MNRIGEFLPKGTNDLNKLLEIYLIGSIVQLRIGSRISKVQLLGSRRQTFNPTKKLNSKVRNV